MQQAAKHSMTEEEEVKYVPDVICPNPNCGAVLQVPSETYAWYEGPVPCRFCHSTMHLSIGDTNCYGNDRTKPFAGSNGGKLLVPAHAYFGGEPYSRSHDRGVGVKCSRRY